MPGGPRVQGLLAGLGVNVEKVRVANKVQGSLVSDGSRGSDVREAQVSMAS